MFRIKIFDLSILINFQSIIYCLYLFIQKSTQKLANRNSYLNYFKDYIVKY